MLHTSNPLAKLAQVNESLTQAWFCNIMYTSFGKLWFNELCKSSKWWHFTLHDIKKKITFINIAIYLIRKVLSVDKLSSSQWQIQILIFMWKLKFYHCQQIHSIVSFKMTGSLCSFSRKCLPNTPVWINHSLSISHSIK